MKWVSLCFVAAISVVSLGAAAEETVSEFVDVESEVAVELHTTGMLICRKEGSLLLLRVSSVALESGRGRLTEECVYTWVLVTAKEVKTGSAKSSITYLVEEDEKGDHHLTRLKGSQELSIGDFSLKWSCAGATAVWIYVRPPCQYAQVVANTQPSGTESTGFGPDTDTD